MTLKLFKILFLLLIVVACNNKTQQEPETFEEQKKTISLLTEADISKLNYVEFDLDQKVLALTESWEPFTKLKTTVTNFKKADFSFFEEDERASTELIFALKKEIPDTLKTQSVLSRITIVENTLHKLDEAHELSSTTKAQLASALKELFIACSNLNFQLNKKLEKDSQHIQRP